MCTPRYTCTLVYLLIIYLIIADKPTSQIWTLHYHMAYKPKNLKYSHITLKDARKSYLPVTYPDDLGPLLPFSLLV